MANSIQFTQLFIDNEWVPARSGNTFDVVNPTTGELLAKVAEADAEDVDIAVASSRKAFEKWGVTDGAERSRLLHKLADLIEQNASTIATVESMDVGMHINTARYIAPNTASSLRYYASFAEHLVGKHIPTSTHHIYTILEPYGVCAGVLPWNFPFSLAIGKLGPALVTGNTIILKPSEKAPLSTLILADLIKQAGFPPGVVNVLPGFGKAGAALSSHMGVDKIGFTGSVVTGKKIMEAAAKSNLKKVTLELGGKSPLIVFPDADLDFAVQVAHNGLFRHQGQVCIASSRIFVHESVYEKFVEKSVERAKKRVIGSPQDPNTECGPVIDQIQFDRVLGYIEKGKAEGAKLMCGGARHGDRGYFIEPTVFADVKDDMVIAREEIFGPVMGILPFKDTDEVVRRANDTTYGLAAYVVTRDISTAHKVARMLKAGMVAVNTFTTVNKCAPFGGYKQSGIGRENGEEGVMEYCQVKSVFVALL